MCEISSPIVSFSPINIKHTFQKLETQTEDKLSNCWNNCRQHAIQAVSCNPGSVMLSSNHAPHTLAILHHGSWLHESDAVIISTIQWNCIIFIKVSQQPDIKTIGMLNFLIRTGRTGRLSGREVLPDFGIRTRVYFHLNRPHYILPNTQLNGYINYFFVFVKWTQQ